MAILIAAHRAGAPRLKKLLADHELSFVGTLDEAKRTLGRRQFSAIVLGVQFDESRVLALLDHLRRQTRLSTPVVCVIGIRGRLSDAALKAFEQAATALGASAVLDMEDFPDDERGNERLRRVVDRVILASPAASPPAGR